MLDAGLLDALHAFSFDGAVTDDFVRGGLRYFVNAFWTAGQRQAHSLHEISYRACFKPQLPEFFIARLTAPGETVYDPFSGRGTTALQAALMGRRPAANDINPLSAMLLRPRFAPPDIGAIAERLESWDVGQGALPADPSSQPPPSRGAGESPLPSREEVGGGVVDPRTHEPTEPDPLLAFYHPRTLVRLRALRRYLQRQRSLDAVDDWVRMVALNRLTGHSPGFFSVYTLPPNQATSVAAQRRINAIRNQQPPPRDVHALILRKSKSLLADGPPPPHPAPLLTTGPADATPALADASVALIVTSPPFLDVVDYQGDNWLRCWFAGIAAADVALAQHRTVPAWQAFVRACFEEFARVLRPGGHVAFEVGEVRGGSVLLEHHVAAAMHGLPFDLLGVMVNRQAFTKTANCWGVGNNARGTNTNRIVLARRRC